MSRIQEPPSQFAELSLRTEEIEPISLVRLAWSDPATHCRFGRQARYRFDAPEQSFGVMYAAFDLMTAFAETVLREEPKRSREVILDYQKGASRVVVEMTSDPDPRRLRLIKLYDEGLAAAQTDNQISCRDHYPTTQRWAKAFHDHPVLADGIVYLSRYLGARKSVVLFDRGSDVVVAGRGTPLLQHPDFADIVELFQLAIDRP